jgi:hypothetical protein
MTVRTDYADAIIMPLAEPHYFRVIAGKLSIITACGQKTAAKFVEPFPYLREFFPVLKQGTLPYFSLCIRELQKRDAEYAEYIEERG